LSFPALRRTASRATSTLLALAPLLLGVAACEDFFYADEDTADADTAESDQCVDDDDCSGSNYVCVAGACEWRCDAHDDCPKGYYCEISRGDCEHCDATSTAEVCQWVCGDGVCDAHESCPPDCQSGPVCGDGQCEAGESCPADCATTPTCPQRPGYVAPLAPPALSCGAPGPTVVAIMNDVNAFWMSSIVPCPCGPDVPAQAGGPYCVGNAFAMTTSLGYVWYDPNKLASLAAQAQNDLGAAWFLAHEVGHNIQYKFGLFSQYTIGQELSADCLAGYYIGSVICRGLVTESAVSGALSSVCGTQDPVGTPWFAPGAHGTCSQRVNAVVTGINAYFSLIPPLDACWGY